MGFLQPIFQNIWGGLLYLPMPWQAVIVIISLIFCLPFIFLRFIPWLIAKFLQIAFAIGYALVYIVFWFIFLIETPLCNIWDGIADILRGIEWFFQRLLRLIEKTKESSYKFKNSAFQYKWLLKNKVFYLSPLIVVILWFSRPLFDSIPSIASIIDTSIGAWCSLEHWNMTGQWKPSELTCSYPTRASRWDINFKFIEYQTKQKILDITEKIAKKPQDALLIVNRGDLFLNIEEYTSAKKDFDKALSLNGNYAPAYVGRGKVYLELGDEDKAYTEFSLALEKDPKYPPAFTGRGDVYRKKNDKEAALIEYQKAYELDPQNPLTYYGRGNLLDRQA
jgi:tetratricopeptide (TPR) repeat protein